MPLDTGPRDDMTRWRQARPTQALRQASASHHGWRRWLAVVWAPMQPGSRRPKTPDALKDARQR